MSKFLIYKPADLSLDEIWDYSLHQWGEVQAEAYIHGIFEAIRKAASREVIWRSLKHEIHLDVYFIKYQHHFVFFRDLDDETIGVISIIHERRDYIAILKQEEKQIH